MGIHWVILSKGAFLVVILQKAQPAEAGDSDPERRYAADGTSSNRAGSRGNGKDGKEATSQRDAQM